VSKRDKNIDPILRAAERQGWRVSREKRYYKMWCPCPAKHWKTVHLTPSDRNYVKNLLGQLKRSTCWKR